VPKTIRVTTGHVAATTVYKTPIVGSGIVPGRGRPDLAVVDIRVDNNTSADPIESAWKVTATIKNVGRWHYRSAKGRQVFVLYKNGNLVAHRSFKDLPVGQTLSLSVKGQHGPAVYEARIVFAEDIRQDGNPLNDDTNPQNDLLSRKLNPA